MKSLLPPHKFSPGDIVKKDGERFIIKGKLGHISINGEEYIPTYRIWKARKDGVTPDLRTKNKWHQQVETDMELVGVSTLPPVPVEKQFQKGL